MEIDFELLLWSLKHSIIVLAFLLSYFIVFYLGYRKGWNSVVSMINKGWRIEYGRIIPSAPKAPSRHAPCKIVAHNEESE